MHTILVPFDGSSHALKALTIACDLADKYGGEIALLHVLGKSRMAADLLELAGRQIGPTLAEPLREAAATPPGTVPEDLNKAVGERLVEIAAERARRRGVEVKALPVEFGNPVEAILIARKATDAGTIVMGCRGVSGGEGSSLGSVSDAVFQRAECTCLAVK